MCDSPVESSSCLSESHSKCSYSSANYCNSAHDLRGDFLLLEAGTPESCNRNGAASPYRFQLERDVQKLQQQLKEEMELHASLEGAIARNAERLSSPSCLPHHTQEIMSNIAILEDTISELEQQLVSLHFQLSQERNERRLAEYRLKHSSIQSSLRCSKHSIRGHGPSPREIFPEELKEVIEPSTDPSCTNSFGESVVDSGLHLQGGSLPEKMDSGSCPPTKYARPTKGMTSKGLWKHPNKLAEEMVRCMQNIFICLADSALPAKSSISDSHRSSVSPRGHLSTSSLWSLSERSMISSWVQSPQIDMSSNLDVFASENAFDPYRMRGKLSWAEIGNYGFATEVSWMSVGKKQLEYAAGALRGFRILVEQLAKVNPIHLCGDEKLAFWINLYNALLMHAYLAYGVPRSDLKLFSLMQKAAYTVGGHSFSAAAIEYAILKMKPPVHRPQISLLLALHKLKVSEEQRKFATDTFEPLVTFALSCGSYSSPAVRIYTAENVREELQETQRDFIRASVGLSSKGKLLVPKMLHCFARGVVDDANLAVWISHYLPPHQAGFVEHCMSQRRQSLLGSRNCGILPFDSRFRYLFLPDKIPL